MRVCRACTRVWVRVRVLYSFNLAHAYAQRIITTNLFTASVHKVDMEQTLKLVLTLLEDEQQEVSQA